MRRSPTTTAALLAGLLLGGCTTASAPSDARTLPPPPPTATTADGDGGCRPTTTEPPVPVAEAAPPQAPFPWDAPAADVALADGFDPAEVRPGGPPPDGILPVDTPCVVDVATADAWLADEESVLLVELDGVARAYPLAIMTQHEIVNDVLADTPLLVTYCPLCNSGIAFERTRGGEAWDFGTSGRLLRSNLVMYDRQTRTLWSQFTGAALWGDPAVVGHELPRVPTQLVAWSTVRDTLPDATVLGRDSVPGREYGRNPYPGLEGASSGFLFEGDADDRLPPDDRVVGIGDERAAVAVPLERLREEQAVTVEVDDDPVTVVWAPGQASALDDATVAGGTDVGQTGAFAVDGLEPLGDGTFRDPATAAVHDVTGAAVDGDAANLPRVPLDDTFWFVWFAFRPDTAVAS